MSTSNSRNMFPPAKYVWFWSLSLLPITNSEHWLTVSLPLHLKNSSSRQLLTKFQAANKSRSKTFLRNNRFSYLSRLPTPLKLCEWHDINAIIIIIIISSSSSSSSSSTSTSSSNSSSSMSSTHKCYTLELRRFHPSSMHDHHTTVTQEHKCVSCCMWICQAHTLKRQQHTPYHTAQI